MILEHLLSKNVIFVLPDFEIRGDRARTPPPLAGNPPVFGADFLKSLDLAENWDHKKKRFRGPKTAISKGKSVKSLIFGAPQARKNSVF